MSVSYLNVHPPLAHILICATSFSLQSSKPDKQEVSDNVKVVVRCRPLNQKEKSMGHKLSVIVDEIRGTITVNKLETSQEPPKTFTFDTVFGPDSKQLDVYNLTARPIIDSVLEGYNGKVRVIKPVLQNVITPSVITHILHLKLYCSSLFFVILLVILFSVTYFRHNFCIWANWHGKNIHHGGCESSARTQRNNPKFFRSCFWSYCQGRGGYQV